MSTSFKKIIFIISSVVFSYFTMRLLGWVYLNYLVSGGDTFGGELIVLFPLGLVGAYVYYIVLNRIFSDKNSPNFPQ